MQQGNRWPSMPLTLLLLETVERLPQQQLWLIGETLHWKSVVVVRALRRWASAPALACCKLLPLPCLLLSAGPLRAMQ
jgi:hypothetical protein